MQQEHNMITFRKGSLKFTFRVEDVIIRDGHVLLQHAEQQRHWFLTGGRAELRESTAETITREMREELGIEVRVERLLWVVENFFELAAILHHELGLYFLVSIPDDAYLNTPAQSFTKTHPNADPELTFPCHPLYKLPPPPVDPLRYLSPGPVRRGDAARHGWIAHLPRLAFHDEVKLVHGDGEDTVGVVREVLRFAGGCASIEVPGAIYPEDSQRHHMRPAVRTHRCQPTGMPVRSTRSRSLGHTLLQALGDFPPRDRWRKVAERL